jgi:hypothetical protein
MSLLQYKIKNPLLIGILAVLLVCWLLMGTVSSAKDANETALKIKTISKDKVSEEQSNESLSNYTQRAYKWENGYVKKAKVKDGTITATVTSPTRAAGGITLELFCRDNMQYYMPVWGGSSKDWEFTQTDIRRSNIDGCYFGTVDTTAQMEAMK